jgi:hypothetical protein
MGHKVFEAPPLTTEGSGRVIRAEGENGVLRRVGRAHAWRVHMGLAANQGESLLDVFDAHSQPMCDLYAALFDPETDYFAGDIVRQFEALARFDCPTTMGGARSGQEMYKSSVDGRPSETVAVGDQHTGPFSGGR